jgi:nicotinate-nucleotide pyrophosphorylase (carboxylating)
MWRKNIRPLIERAIEEDLPKGDITSDSIIAPEYISRAIILAKQDGILAGIYVAKKVFKVIDSSIRFDIHCKDGQKIKKGEKLAGLKGPAVSLLRGERTALNFLQRLSGIATVTHKYVRALEKSNTKVLDTRKTTPGLRMLEKYAVKMGGGENHRFSLSDMVLIKDNHLKIVGSITQAIQLARKKAKPGMKIEVETSCLEDVQEAVKAGADMIMLDNMSMERMKDVIKWARGRIVIEISGNINLTKAKKIGRLGADYISVGALTHSYESLDISMDFIG